MLRFLNRIWRNDRGTSAVEFAIVAPVFIAMFIGAISICGALFLIGSLHYAVEEGARCASVKALVCTDATTTVAYTKSHYFFPSGSPTFTYSSASCGHLVSASVNYSVSWIFGSATIPFKADACFP